jgi:hypothetical protein
MSERARIRPAVLMRVIVISIELQLAGHMGCSVEELGRIC